MVKRGRIDESEKRPEVDRYKVMISSYIELGTERANGPIPVSKIREYLSIHGLPDYWYPAIHQIDRNQLQMEYEKNGSE